MNQQQAKWLLDDTFNNDFNVLKFSNFLKELINNSNLSIRDKSQYIPNEFKDYILKFEKLGQYKDKNGKSLELLAIKLAKHSSLERARTMQRNFIANWLNKDEIEGAIVAFYDDEKDWRFSFVKLEYNLIKDEKGNLKTKKELTPAKRYSYLVGPNEPNHTCKKQFVDLLSSDHNPLFEKIEMSFGIEKVTKEFFEEYKKRFLDLKESLEKVIKNNASVKTDFIKITGEENLERYIIEFSKKLLGQIVFLYFLQKKGWLGVRKDDSGRFRDWGTGPKDFMKRLFNKEYCSYNNFFNDVLEPLFYNTLAIKRNDDFSDKFDCKIPFLNGGLFEPLDNYDWMNTNIYIENSIFEDIFRTFDEFNFTVKEDEPLEKEVAVDPEMLGKVFENLLEVKDRKSKGAFYTPREIVHYMCQQSLINYLETNSSIPRKDIEKFIQEGDKYLDQTIRAQEQKKKYHGHVYGVDSEYTIPKSIEKNYLVIDKLLKEIKVVDPAVGSGAFPIGMMNEIVKARSILSIYFEVNRDVSEIKRECIENSLYGVDIMPSAVDICQLRFWLSLIVDELDRKKIKPLPNLDNKIMCGNSLLEEFEGIKLFDDSLLGEIVKDVKPELDRIDKEIKELNLKNKEISLGKSKGSINDIKKSINKLKREKSKLTAKPETKGTNLTLMNFDKVTQDEAKIKLNKLKAKQKEFFNSFDRDTKKQLKQEIEKLEWELIEATLKQQGNEESIKKLNSIMKSKSKPFFLWKLYFAEVFQRENPGFDVVIGNPPYTQVPKGMVNIESFPFTEGKDKGKQNLYKLFIEHSYNLCREMATTVLIVQSSLLCDISSQYTRELLLTKTNLDGFIEFPKIADNKIAQVFDTVLQGTCVFSFVKKLPSKEHKFFISINNDRTTIDNLELEWINQLMVLDIYSEGYLIPLIRPGEFALLRKLSEGNSLKDFTEYSKQGDLNLSTNKDLIVDYNTGINFYRGKNVHRYYFDSKTKEFMDLDKNKKMKDCFSKMAEKNNKIEKLILMQQITGTKDRYRLHATLFSKIKSIFGHSVRLIKVKNIEPKWVLLLLNSHLLDWFFRKTSTNNNVNGYELEQLPIKKISTEEQKPLIEIVDRILSITSNSDYSDNVDKQAMVKALEKRIDKIVYDIYELTSEEIKIIEEFKK